MHAPTDEHIGARVARLRVLRHLTQEELATRAHVSKSLISKVERGTVPASPQFVGAVARALSASTAEINGQPYTQELQAEHLDGLIQPIREALDVYDLGPDPDIQARSFSELHADTERMSAIIREANLRKAATELPALIHEVTTAAHSAPSAEIWRVLTSLYRSAYDLASKLGYPDLGTTALDRVEWVAAIAGDAVWASLRQYMRSLAYLRSAQYRTGRRLTSVGLRTVEQADPGLERDVVIGQLHLGAAILAARDQDGDAAAGHLDEAGRIADRTGPSERTLWVAFGPANVAIHRVAAYTELHDYGTALREARNVSLATLPKTRQGHHYADLARAQMWAGKPDDAYATLRTARQVAPQQTRYSPVVRQTMEGLTSHYRSVPDHFARFASWVGM